MANVELLDLAAQRERIDVDIQDRLSAVMTHGRYINGPEVGALEAASETYSGAAPR
jgi:UDP-2-acetamido-2-deoxy-ribo-hexuluronate aminotransferase